jgi:sterol desaturase/sphingolipid hydroxylase (fatty acid hydroxylase superfamily)
MRLSKIGYYSDFLVYPLCIVGLAVAGLRTAGAQGIVVWLVIAFSSVVIWTLVEYGLHRFAFHELPYVKELHQQHHDEERGLLGTPIWISLAAHCLLVFLPLLLISNLALASAVSSGLMLGYLWYVSVHHILHHWHMSHGSYLYLLKRRHALHHHSDTGCNFGVTTALWDRVFQTAATDLSVHGKAMHSAQSSR